MCLKMIETNLSWNENETKPKQNETQTKTKRNPNENETKPKRLNVDTLSHGLILGID